MLSLFSFVCLNRKPNIRYIFLFLFFICSMEAYSGSNIGSYLHVSAQYKDFEFYKIKSYLLSAGKLVSDTLDIPFSKNCRIYLKDSTKKEIKLGHDHGKYNRIKKGILRIYLKNSYSLITENREVSRALLNTFVLFTLNLSYSKENIEKITWFVSALNRKLDRLVFPVIYPDSGSFPGMHGLLLYGYKLQPDIVINNRVYSNKGVVYKINSEADEILLDSILSLKNGSKILVDYFKSICLEEGTNNIEVFYSVLSENLKKPSEECKAFFIKHLNDTAFKLSINSFMPASVKYMTNAFNNACTVSYTSKKKSGCNKRMFIRRFTPKSGIV